MPEQSDYSPSARVVTFYSYKGGTGRSMALANVAWILASNGKTVLAIDWDLEAPGLHRYFAPFLEDPKMEATDGLIDQLYSYQRATSRPPSDDSTGADWVGEYADVQRYAEPLHWEFPNSGRIDLLGPGRQDRRYGERMNLFDWHAFYETYGGGAFFETMLERARSDYDYVLIDSRTGVSDTSGICTVHLPDSLAVFYTLNDQSIEGASAVARDALNKRRTIDGDYSFRVYPIATRIEFAEQDKLHERRRLARKAFEPLVDYIVDRSELDEYFGAMELQYVPYYAYEEILATVVDQPDSRNSLLESFETVTSRLTNGEVRRLAKVSETRRKEAKTSYTTMVPTESIKTASEASDRYDVFVSFQREDEEIAKSLIRHLRAYCKVFDRATSINPGEHFGKAITRAMESSRLVLVLVADEIAEIQLQEIQHALEIGAMVVPVWQSSRAEENARQMLPELATRSGFMLRSRNDFKRVEDSVRRVLGISQESSYDSAEVSAPASAISALSSTWSGRAAISAIVLIVMIAVVST